MRESNTNKMKSVYVRFGGYFCIVFIVVIKALWLYFLKKYFSDTYFFCLCLYNKAIEFL